MVVSHHTDNAVIGAETTYGTEASTYNYKAGIIQRFTYQEVENFRRISDINNQHKYLKNEPGLYYVQGTLETIPTKESLPGLLETFFGSRTDATDYTISSDPDSIDSLSAKAQYISGQVAKITGIVLTTLKIEIAKDGDLVYSFDYIGQKLVVSTETISYTTDTGSQFTDLDCYVSYGETNMVLETFSAIFDWKIDPRKGRGVESVTAGSRRLIQRVVKNTLDISGNFDAELTEDVIGAGYEDEKTDSTIVFNYSRGTDNAHAISFTGCYKDNNEVVLEPTDDTRRVTADFGALDFAATGDL